MWVYGLHLCLSLHVYSHFKPQELVHILHSISVDFASRGDHSIHHTGIISGHFNWKFHPEVHIFLVHTLIWRDTDMKFFVLNSSHTRMHPLWSEVQQPQHTAGARHFLLLQATSTSTWYPSITAHDAILWAEAGHFRAWPEVSWAKHEVWATWR